MDLTQAITVIREMARLGYRFFLPPYQEGK